MSDDIGHYRIRQKLGSGGMGDVYLAEDLRLHRLVALKVLPPDVARDAQRRTRFVQEAHAASVLSHPNVSTIHEVGEDGDTVFISMEYIDGKTLTQVRETRALSVDEVVDIALQTADALDEAQARGIVHRDIKSANIMLTARGHVKVLDFGLAKVIAPEMEASELTKIKTGAGMIVGTPYYMSPEQALGRAVDHRSDLFSLGVVLYELVTGKLPFVGATTTETINEITHAEPDPMARFNYSLPPELERIVRKLLEKEPGRRYQSARDLIVDLKNHKRDTISGEVAPGRSPRPRRGWVPLAAIAAIVAAAVLTLIFAFGNRPRKAVRVAEAEAIDSIAVLPFVNASRNADNEYLSDGISETITNDLSRIAGLRVVPRGTVFQFRGQETDLQKVAETLNVRAIVTGRVLQRGDLLSVQAELVDTESNAQLWGARYERKVSDALALQQEISRQVSERIRSKGEAATPARTAGAMTRDPEAYQLYLKGRYHWNKRTGESLEKALGYFQQAVARDPGFALGHIGVADSYLLLEQYGDRSVTEMTAKAEVALKKALAIDDGISEAYASLGFVHQNKRQWNESGKAYERAVELNPSYPTARHWYNIYLRQVGRVDEALVQVRKAQELDPLSMIIGSNVADVLAIVGQRDEALREAEKYLEIDPDFAQMLGIVAQLYSRAGRHAEAVAAAKKAMKNSGEASEQISTLAAAYAAAGDRAAAMPLVLRLKEKQARGAADPVYLARVYAALGDKDRAFAALEQAVKSDSGMIGGIKVDQWLENLQSDPRFSQIVRKLGLPASSSTAPWSEAPSHR